MDDILRHRPEHFFFLFGDYGGEMCDEMRGCEFGVFSDKGLDLAIKRFT